MRAFKSISVRFQRRTALGLLFSYGALVILLTFHFHSHAFASNHDALRSAAAGTGPHGHVIATCPLQYYLLFAFQAEPGTPTHSAVLSSAHAAFLPSDPGCLSCAGDFRLSRAPPSIG